MDIDTTTMTGAEGTADTGTTDTRTGEQMLMDAFAEHGSGNSGEVADPVNAESEDDHDPRGDAGAEDDASDASAGAEDNTKPKQDKETNAIYADARRRAEAKLQRDRQAFETEKQRAIQDGINAEIAQMGLVDPATGQSIKDAEGLRAYREALAARRMEQAAGAKGMTADELKELVELHPDVAAAKAEREENARQAEANQRAAAEARLNSDIAEIGKLNPSIKSFSDLRALDRFDAIYEKIKRGYSVIDAYRTEYSDALTEARVREAEQRVRNGAAGKSHMQRMDSRGDGGVEVPNDEVSLLSRLTGKSAEEARRSLSRFHSK